MRQQIITQSADMAVILRYLSGEYRPPLSSRIVYWILAALCLVLAAVMAVDLVPGAEATADERSGAILVLAVTAVGAGAMVRQAHTSYHFAPDAIERRSLLPFWRRRLAVAHVHEGYLLFDQGVALELVPTEGRKLVIPLEGALRDDVARLYPEIGTGLTFRAPVASPRLRPIIYVSLALVVAAFIALAVVLTQQGKLAW